MWLLIILNMIKGIVVSEACQEDFETVCFTNRPQNQRDKQVWFGFTLRNKFNNCLQGTES